GVVRSGAGAAVAVRGGHSPRPDVFAELIAVGRSEPFWTRRGFTAYPGIAPGGYGANAVYMSRPQVRGDGRVDETS
ncbi:hypothetical protein ABZ372_55810, partial [Streptomyces sp. NPDC005921]